MTFFPVSSESSSSFQSVSEHNMPQETTVQKASESVRHLRNKQPRQEESESLQKKQAKVDSQKGHPHLFGQLSVRCEGPSGASGSSPLGAATETTAARSLEIDNEQLQQVIRESIGRESDIDLLVRDLQQKPFDLQKIIRRYREMGAHYLAKDGFIACRNGRISKEQYSYMSQCGFLMHTYPHAEIKIQPCFDASGNAYPLAKTIYIQTLKAHQPSLQQEEAIRQCEEFFNYMKKTPNGLESCLLYMDPDLKPPMKKQLQVTTFETVTRHMPKEKLQQVFSESIGRENHIERLTSDLQQPYCDWPEIIERYRKMGTHYLAKDGLIAFKNGHISMEQFSTLTTCWSLMNDFPDAVIGIQPLFDAAGQAHPLAKEALLQGMRATRYFFREEEINTICERFFNNMKNRSSASEKVFFYINSSPINLDPLTGNEKLSLVDYFERVTGFMVFYKFFLEDPVSKKPSYYRMIPSFSMIQAFVNAYGQENTIAPSPVIGFSTFKELYNNIIQRGRDVLLPFPGVFYKNEKKGRPTEYPSNADSYDCHSYSDFFLHDTYHCIICSCVPDACRQKTANMTKATKQLRDKYKKGSLEFVFLNQFFEKLLDMEFAGFELGHRFELEKWHADSFNDGEILLYSLRIVLHHIPSQTMGLKYYAQGGKNYSRNLRAFETTSPVFRELAEIICDEEFFQKFSIHPEKLLKLERDYREYIKASSSSSNKNISIIVQVLEIYEERAKHSHAPSS